MMNQALELTLESEATRSVADLSPYTQLFFDSLATGKSLGASDIHFQPEANELCIRFRVNGDMRTWKVLTNDHQLGFINEAKRLSGLSIAISGRAQDGRATFKEWGLDVRANLLPSHYGEKIVLRLLDQTRDFSLSKLHLSDATSKDLTKSLDSENGIIFVSGPTGSGKTTTLYSLLNSIDKRSLNIVTVEDPVEYSFDGITQVQVSHKLTFGDALRGILRQDPDVILVGEIRDSETAELAIKAALTGHLVLSTIHANNSREVISRLMNLGVDPFLIKSCIRFSGAQRLIKRICPKCCTQLNSEDQDHILKALKEIQNGIVNRMRLHNPAGCDNCQSGFIGRIPVLEYLSNEDLNTWSGLSEGLAEIRPEISLHQEILNKILKGEASAAEISKI